MSVPIHEGHQVIYQEGKPAFVAVPYADYLELVQHREEPLIPHEVVENHIVKGMSLIKAWRIHLGKNQKDMAQALGITQPGYAQIEKSESPHQATLEKIAQVMGIDISQLNM